MTNAIVRIMIDEDGEPQSNAGDWHLVVNYNFGDPQALCTGEYFGYGQGNISDEGIHYETSRGRVTCEKCREIIRFFKNDVSLK